MAKKRANGEGNIRKRADGRWEGRYTAGYHPETGKRIIKNVLGKTQAECKAKLKKAIEESHALDVGRADEYTVAAWLRTWFDLYAKPHIRPSTMNYYHRNIEQHIIPAIGDIPLNKLTTRDLQKLYNDLQSNGRLRKVQKKEKPGLRNSTVRGIHMMLHNALDPGIVGLLVGTFDELLEFPRVPGGGFGLRLGVGLGYARLRSRRFLGEELQAPAVDKVIHADPSIGIRSTALG